MSYYKKMNSFYAIFKSIEEIGISFDELLIISFLSSQWNLNNDVDSKKMTQNFSRYSKSTMHRKLNLLRNKNVIDYQVDYEDGRKILIIKGKCYLRVTDELKHIIENFQPFSL